MFIMTINYLFEIINFLLSIDGIAKGNPDDADKKGAVEFFDGLFR